MCLYILAWLCVHLYIDIYILYDYTHRYIYIYTCIHVVTQSCIYLYIHFLFKFMCVRVCMSPWWSRSSMRIPINQHFIRILSRYFWHGWRDLKFREISNLCSWTIRGLSRWNLAISGNSYTATRLPLIRYGKTIRASLTGSVRRLQPLCIHLVQGNLFRRGS